MPSSIWMSETSPEEFRAECPHVRCHREEIHDAHGWRGTRREFGGAVEVTRTYWCEGRAPETPGDPEEACCHAIYEPHCPYCCTGGSRPRDAEEASDE